MQQMHKWYGEFHVLKNINRVMDKKLILLVYNDDLSDWELPTIEFLKEDTLRDVSAINWCVVQVFW